MKDLVVDTEWEQFLENREDSELRNKLVVRYHYIVVKTAEVIHKKLPSRVQLDDLITDGTFGLIEALMSFDPERNIKFQTYSCLRIKGAIIDGLRKFDWVPRLVRSRNSKIQQAKIELTKKSVNPPNDADIAEEMGVSIEDYEKFRRSCIVTGVGDLDSPKIITDNGCPVGLRELLKDEDGVPPELSTSKQDLINVVTKGMSKEERIIVILYYYEGMSMREIGTHIGVSESRVSQMHSIIINRLRTNLEPRKEELFEVIV